MEEVLYGIPDMPEPKPGGIVYERWPHPAQRDVVLYYPKVNPFTFQFDRYPDEADTPLEVKGTE